MEGLLTQPMMNESLKEWKVSILSIDLKMVRKLPISSWVIHAHDQRIQIHDKGGSGWSTRTPSSVLQIVSAIHTERNISTHQIQLTDLKKNIIHIPEAKNPFCHRK